MERTDNPDSWADDDSRTDDEPMAGSIMSRSGDEPVEAGLTSGDVRARSELARHLRGSLFPADRTSLLQFAVEERVPADVADVLRQLPPGRYLNVEGVWEALGGRREERLATAKDPGAVDPVAAAEARVTPAPGAAGSGQAAPLGDTTSAPGTESGEAGRENHGGNGGEDDGDLIDIEGLEQLEVVDTASPPEAQRFTFRFDLLHRMAAALFLVSPGSAEVLVDRGADQPTLRVRFGPWRVETTVDNVRSTTITGPYQPLKTVGPAHVSLADRGLTFATNDASGLCIQFREPVPGLEPLGVVRHPSVTVTVADVDGLRAALEPS